MPATTVAAVATARGGGAGGGTIEYAPPSRVTDLYVTRGCLRRAASAWVTSTPLQRRCVDRCSGVVCSCTGAAPAQSARRVRDATVYAVFFPFPPFASPFVVGQRPAGCSYIALCMQLRGRPSQYLHIRKLDCHTSYGDLIY